MIKSIGLIANVTKQSCIDLSLDIHDYISNKYKSVRIKMPLNSAIGRSYADHEIAESDIVVIIGGDGTVLYWGKRISMFNQEVPIVAFNMGTLGFITEFDPKNWQSVIDHLVIQNPLCIMNRTVLDAEFISEDSITVNHLQALNDIIITARTPRMARLEMWINDDHYYSHNADGLSFSTPTGSTGYSMAAGGSIICPDAKVIEVVPLYPHGLNNRPLIVPDHTTFRVSNAKDSALLQITADGQETATVLNMSSIVIKKAYWTVKLVNRTGGSFYDKISRRLEWGKSIQ